MSTTTIERPSTYRDSGPNNAGLASLIDKLRREEGMHIATYSVAPEIIQELGLDGLPQGVAIIGGAARAIAQRVIFHEGAPIRDIDLAVVPDLCETEYSPEVLDGLSMYYMPDDHNYGYGIATVDDLGDYFSTRDFTMNQVIFVDSMVVLTDAARSALREKIVEPTPYELSSDGYIRKSKLYVKAMLMRSLFATWYGGSECSGFRRESEIGDFYIALGLNKAFQYGADVTECFINDLYAQGLVPVDAVYDPIDYARRLADECQFEFRGSETALVVNNREDPMWSDMPSPYGDAEENALDLLETYSGRLPHGVDISEYR